jgi:hypothetical protein
MPPWKDFERTKKCYERADQIAQWELTVRLVSDRHFRKTGFISGFRTVVSRAYSTEPPSFSRSCQRQLAQALRESVIVKRRVRHRAETRGFGNLIEQITVDAYGDVEQLWAFRQAFEDDLTVPCAATIAGAPVTVIKFDFDGNERRGLTAKCRLQDGSQQTPTSSFLRAMLVSAILLPIENGWACRPIGSRSQQRQRGNETKLLRRRGINLEKLNCFGSKARGKVQAPRYIGRRICWRRVEFSAVGFVNSENLYLLLAFCPSPRLWLDASQSSAPIRRDSPFEREQLATKRIDRSEIPRMPARLWNRLFGSRHEWVLLWAVDHTDTSADRGKTVTKPLPLSPLGLALSEKQIPQVVENPESGGKSTEALERAFMRPRQVRYQAALRPDFLDSTACRRPSVQFFPHRPQ